MDTDTRIQRLESMVATLSETIDQLRRQIVPQTPQVSQLYFYSLGLPAANLGSPYSTRSLQVVPIEKLPALDGELNFDPQEQLFKGKNLDGSVYEVKVTTDMAITCEWLPFGTNRVTPPDIRRGEPIAIYRLADTDQYFWLPLGLRDDLRRLETVIYAFNASPDEDTVGIDPQTCYWFEISTHQKSVTFSTSKANGEPFAYTTQYNTAEGRVTLTDDVGNYFELDSAETLIHLENADTTMIELSKRDINAYAPQDCNIKVDRDINVKIGRHLNVQVGGNRSTQIGGNSSTEIGGNDSTDVGGSSSLNAGGSISHSSGGSYSIDSGGSFSVTCASAGDISAGANLTLSAGGAALLTGAAGAMIASAGQSMGVSGGGGTMKVSSLDITS